MTKNLATTMIAVGVVLFTTAAASLKIRSSDANRKDADVVLTNKNTVSLRGPVDDGSVSELIKTLRSLDTDKEVGDPIYLVLYTPGGSIQAGIELIEAVKGMRRPVKTITIFAASMGFQLVQNFDDRLILNGGTLMSHKARGGAEGEFSPNSDSQLDKRLNFWKSRLLEMDNKTVARTAGKQTLKSYQDSYENELWLTGPTSVAGGYADKVVSIRCSESLKGTDDQKIEFMGLSITVKFNKCPLQTAPESIEMKIKTNQGQMTPEKFAAEGGILGVDCTIAQSRLVNSNGQVLCAIDGSLTREKLDTERKKIVHSYTIEGLKEQIGYTW
jgi:ATP-dependent Clp protease protease subunit